mmetsp:Transcript_21049/g.31777  ORF Transcript_21049/g.31777 Transcript_21049/m.31777 type:complete len:317 (+) Transcript_21049:33-983(+)
MVSAKDVILEYICPALGTVLAYIMFLAPYGSVKKASATGSLGDLNPTPWAFMLGNTVGWVAYSFLLNNYWIYFGSCPGLIISVWLNLVAAKLQCQEYRVKEMRRSFVDCLEKYGSSFRALETTPEENGMDTTTNNNNNNATTDWRSLVLQVTTQSKPAPAPHEKIVIIIVIQWVVILSVVALGKNTFSANTQELIVGIATNINFLFFYGGPLSTIFTVLKTRNTATIHTWTMITNTANGAFWTAYGIAVQNFVIAVPNGIGVVLGLVQVALFVLFPRKAVVEDSVSLSDDTSETKEIQEAPYDNLPKAKEIQDNLP